MRTSSRYLPVLALATVLLFARQAKAEGEPLVVGPDGDYATLAEALDAASPGATIEVIGGTHAGPLVLDRSITLIGREWPVIDGSGDGTVVSIAAPDTTFQGFVVRGSGIQPDESDAGILVAAPRARVLNNRLVDVLTGIYLADAPDATVRGNDVGGKVEYDLGRKGDGLRIWYSPGALVEGNLVHGTRDMVVWYSPGVTFIDNVVRDGRYGIHLMYTDDVVIERNDFENNSVGIYAMYANGVDIKDNMVRRQRGPSGYALGFKDTNDVRITGNVLVDNNAAIFLDGTPFTPGSESLFEDNILAFNDIGVVLMPAVKGNVFRGNTLWENITQTALAGGGTAGENIWEDNFWSDYSGFDADADGRGDLPYKSERFFESLTDREPRLRILLYSPTAQAIEAAGMSFPLIRPQPKMIDQTPRIEARALPGFASPAADSRWGVLAAGMILLAVAAAGVHIGFRERW